MAQGALTSIQRLILSTPMADRTRRLVCVAGTVIQIYDRPNKSSLEPSLSIMLRNGDNGRKCCKRVDLDHEMDFCWCVGTSILVFRFKWSFSLPHRISCCLHQFAVCLAIPVWTLYRNMSAFLIFFFFLSKSVPVYTPLVI